MTSPMFKSLERELDQLELRSAQLKQSIAFLQLEVVSSKVGGVQAPVQTQLRQIIETSKMLPSRSIKMIR